MRDLTDDEADKFRKDLINNWEEYFLDQGLKAMQKQMEDDLQKLMLNSFITNSTVTWGPIPSFHHSNASGLSPTDKDAKGAYEYQESEKDEQGTYYGYKVLHICPCGCGNLKSPRYDATWQNGNLESDREPNENSMHGIHCTKRSNHPELESYVKGDNWSNIGNVISVLVRCALSGTIVETEQGFRAQYAQIVNVCEIGGPNHGNWTSYQDYQERADANSRRIAEQKKEWERREWRYIDKTGKGNYSVYYDPSADS